MSKSKISNSEYSEYEKNNETQFVKDLVLEDYLPQTLPLPSIAFKFSLKTKKTIKIPKNRFAYASTQIVIVDRKEKESESKKNYHSLYSKYICNEGLSHSSINVLSSGSFGPNFKNRIIIKLFNHSKTEVEIPPDYTLAYLYVTPFIDYTDLLPFKKHHL